MCSQRRKPSEKATLPPPWSWTSSLQKYKKMNFCWLSHLVYGIFYGTLSKLIYHSFPQLPRIRYSRRSLCISCFRPRTTHFAQSLEVHHTKIIINSVITDIILQFFFEREKIVCTSRGREEERERETLKQVLHPEWILTQGPNLTTVRS